MNKKEWLAKQADPATKKPMPIMSFPCVNLLNITVDELVHNSDYQAKGMAALAEKFPSAAAVSMMDLSVEAEAFGANIVFSPDEVPTVRGILVSDEDEAEALVIPDVGAGRCALYADAIRKAKELITDRPVFAGVIGPFSLAGRLMDMTEIMVACYTDPDVVTAVLEKCTEFIIGYINLFKEAGADGVIMAEPAAGLLSPDFNREFSHNYVKRIIDETITDDYMFIYHNCGNVVPLIDDIITLGADAYHFGNAIDLVALSEKIPDDIVFMGNINPVGIFCDANAEQTYNTTMALLEKLGRKSNYVLSSGCDIPARASFENTEAFYKASADFYK